MTRQIEDGPLAGGTANRGRVIRVGDTVHRPVGPHTPAVHALLRHLTDTGFDATPRVIGLTERSEIVGYIEGTAATDPIPDWALTDEALFSVGALLRGYHAACAGLRRAPSGDGSARCPGRGRARSSRTTT